MLNEESNSDNKNYEYNKNSIDMNIDKFLTIIQSQNEMIRQKDEEIRHLRAELEEVRGYSAVKKSPVDPAKPAETAAYVYIGESVMNK